MLDPNGLSGEIMHRVRPEDFTDASLRNLFAAARELWMKQEPLDPVTLIAKAGEAYTQLLANALQSTPTTANWEKYVELLLEGSKLARLRSIAAAILDSSSLEEGRKHLAKAESLLAHKSGLRSMTYEQMLIDYMERMSSKEPPPRLKWGFGPLDKVLKVSPGRFIVLGADSSVGKTAFALQLARSMAGQGQRVAFFSYETSCEDTTDRVMAAVADVNMPRSKDRTLTIEDYRRVNEEADKNYRVPLQTFESSVCTVDELRSLTLAGRFEVVFIDYIQMIPGRTEERTQLVTDTSIALHRMAMELGVTIVGLSQVTLPEKDKNGKRRYVCKEDLRESKQLIKDAEVILMMDLEFPNIQGSRRLLMIDKNKDGELGKFFLDFDPEHMRFSISRKAPGRKEAEQAERAAMPGQGTFYEMPGGKEGLPF